MMNNDESKEAPSNELRCDYLVVGAGAAGMAFVDTLLTEDPTCRVVLVDRRAKAGGHWVDSYPFVRLHQPSHYYGCLLYTSPSPRDYAASRMPSSA